MMTRQGKGIGLLSGGLDSILAVKVLQEQPLDLVGVTFTTPFFGPEPGLRAGRLAGIPTRVVDVGEVFLRMLKNPPHGYGRHMNPCIDCHGLMLREAAKIMMEEGADFLFTGEVVGQRPMSQRRAAMKIVEKMSGVAGRILRPLSAKLLEPTIVEREGLVDREKLLDIHGRGRKRQMELAEFYGIREIPQPGGGCMLTKEGFARKLKELFAIMPHAETTHVERLKWGRHFRLGTSGLLAVGRSKHENERLSAMAGPDDVLLRVPSHPGPTGLLFGTASRRAHVQAAAMIVTAYSDVAPSERVEVLWKQGDTQGWIRVKNVGRTPWLRFLL